ncbi:FecR domain-containing protein [Allorhodopirellula heiligendammensis]|uniref:FecR protein n=1 Tax=Allorhodopirellula heiligendammensis TaxID=2714739 RepID=A0A5C6C976_9BACT|nr:FecR domain-containing protein [Allorhodopirellula heiligendammensis]TWU19966.1 FecR protein [Allorhodopirellula heiligendammensis]
MINRLEEGRFDQLLNALIDRRITAVQFEELGFLLLDDPIRQRRYLDEIAIHLELAQLLRCDRYTPGIPVEIESAAKRSRLSHYRMGLLALAMTILIVATSAGLLIKAGLGGRVSESMPRGADLIRSHAAGEELSAQVAVVLAQNSSAEFFGTMPPAVGATMEMNRQYIMTYGSIELAFPKGATALLEAPAIFLVASTERLYLESGQCSVHAPDGAEGFQLETPLANVIDLGTRFGVSVDISGETNVQVIEGAAEVIEKDLHGAHRAVPALLKANDVGVYPADVDRIESSLEFDPSAYRYGLRDRILQYKASMSESPDARGVEDLLSISVQRGGRPYDYRIEQMIPSEITSFRSTQPQEVQPVAYRFGDERPISELLRSDNSLDTGILNPGASKVPLTTSPDENTVGMALRFAQPVVNSAGPDIVLFELQGYGNPKQGDAFHVSPLQFREGLHSHTIGEFDIPMTSPEALEVAGFGLLRFEHSIDSLSDLDSGRYSRRYRHFNFRALAVGIDLSDLGYAEGDVVTGMFLQDADDDDDTHNGGSMVDPVYVGGFPPILSDRQDVPSELPARNGKIFTE